MIIIRKQWLKGLVIFLMCNSGFAMEQEQAQQQTLAGSIVIKKIENNSFDDFLLLVSNYHVLSGYETLGQVGQLIQNNQIQAILLPALETMDIDEQFDFQHSPTSVVTPDKRLTLYNRKTNLQYPLHIFATLNIMQNETKLFAGLILYYKSVHGVAIGKFVTPKYIVDPQATRYKFVINATINSPHPEVNIPGQPDGFIADIDGFMQ